MANKKTRLAARRRAACDQGRKQNQVLEAQAVVRRAQWEREQAEQQRARQERRRQSGFDPRLNPWFELFARMMGVEFEELLRLVELFIAEAQKASGSTGPRGVKVNTRHYETLGAEESDDMDTITEKFKALAKKLHPDARGGDTAQEDRLKEVIEAYQAIKIARTGRK